MLFTAESSLISSKYEPGDADAVALTREAELIAEVLNPFVSLLGEFMISSLPESIIDLRLLSSETFETIFKSISGTD